MSVAYHPVTSGTYNTRKYAYLSNPDPEFAALAAQIPPVSNDVIDDIPTFREHFNDTVIAPAKSNYRSHLPPASEYQVEDHKVLVEGGEILIRCLVPTPAGEDNTWPLFVWFHAGGWTIGSIDLDDFALRILCVELQIAIVNVEYRLAPEHPFPTGLNDSYAALKWAAETMPVLHRVSLSKGFIIGGMSAGGNIATVCALRARDDPFFSASNGKQLTGQVLQVPTLIHPEAYPEKWKSELLSIEENIHAPFLSRADMEQFYKNLAGTPTDPLISPMLAPSHAGLPPTYTQVSGLDILRDEGILYHKVLEEAGVPSRLDVYPGVPHGFHYAFANIEIAVKLQKDLREGVRWLLSYSTQAGVETSRM